MEQMQCLVLQLILQLLQFLFITIKVQKMDIDCGNVGEHVSRNQTTNKELGSWTDSTEYVKKMYNTFVRVQSIQTTNIWIPTNIY